MNFNEKAYFSAKKRNTVSSAFTFEGKAGLKVNF